jgi:isoleucyl-tRNA synthetase
MIAPFTPFLAEAMWRNLAGSFGERAVSSVHLCDYPRWLSRRMSTNCFPIG